MLSYLCWDEANRKERSKRKGAHLEKCGPCQKLSIASRVWEPTFLAGAADSHSHLSSQTHHLLATAATAAAAKVDRLKLGQAAASTTILKAYSILLSSAALPKPRPL